MSNVSFNTPPKGDLKWLAVDLDDTLAEGVWSPDNPDTGVGRVKQHNAEKMISAWSDGWKIVIHTARPWHDYEKIEEWLFLNDLHNYVSRIVCGKLLAAAYIDDKAVHESEDSWLPPPRSKIS